MSVPPPSKHQLALMIWLAVFPTLVVLNLSLGQAARRPSRGAADLRPGHGRRADRDLRPDAAAAPAPCAAPDQPLNHPVAHHVW